LQLAISAITPSGVHRGRDLAPLPPTKAVRDPVHRTRLVNAT
jgi:hypothetical protein